MKYLVEWKDDGVKVTRVNKNGSNWDCSLGTFIYDLVKDSIENYNFKGDWDVRDGVIIFVDRYVFNWEQQIVCRQDFDNFITKTIPKIKKWVKAVVEEIQMENVCVVFEFDI